MTKITLLSLVAASVLFTACGDDTKKAAAETTAKTTEVVKETASNIEKAAADAAKATKKAAEKLAKAAKEKADDLKASAVKTTEAAAKLAEEVISDNDTGEAAYAKCSGCHGKDGKTKALGKSEVIAGQSEADLISKLNAYKEGTRDVAGMGTLMKGQLAAMSEDDILAVSGYISGL